MERKRRDHIKDSFSSLRDSVPSLHGEKVINVIIKSNHSIIFSHFVLFFLFSPSPSPSSLPSTSPSPSPLSSLFIFLTLFFIITAMILRWHCHHISNKRLREHKYWRKLPSTFKSWEERTVYISKTLMIWKSKIKC